MADLVELHLQLGRDAALDPEQLRRRDRQIGQRLADLRDEPAAQVRRWLCLVRPEHEPDRGHQAELARRLLGLVLGALGLLLGSAAAMAVLRYDGTRPVNVVHVLAAFVALPLLVLFAIVALPGGLTRWLPGARVLQESLAMLSPGRLSGPLMRLLPQQWRQALQGTLGEGRRGLRLYGRVEKWMLATWSQQFAVSFFLGAVGTFAALVVFTDLAFSWSTTLDVDAATFARLTRALALPWRRWLPAAVPSAQVVESTRYFRLGPALGHGGAGASADVGLLGRWWAFLMAAVVCYGLLPRALALALAAWRLRAALHAAIASHPGVFDLRDRMNRQLVQTAAPDTAPAPPAGVAEPALGAADPEVSGRPAIVVDWAGVGVAEAAAAGLAADICDVQVAAVLHAGGSRTLEADRQVVAQIAAEPRDPVAVVLVKAWEPPLLELLDFLGELRRALGGGRPILVLPLPLPAAGPAAPEPAADLGIWQRKVASVGDPWLAVLAPGPRGAVGGGGAQ